MQRRGLVTIISSMLVACSSAGLPEPASPRAERAERAVAARPGVGLSKQVALTSKLEPGARSAKEDDDDYEPQDFSGVAVAAPKEDKNAKTEREVAVEGIEGTMSEFDVRTPLENRDTDFDHCHDQFRGGSGRIVFRIHINANGEVGHLKAQASKASKQIVECYSEVVSSTKFSRPHGGYADVKWTTKVGRSRKRRGEEITDRNPKLRWDAPSTLNLNDKKSESSSSSSSDDSEGRRERRHRSRRHRKGA